MTQDTNRDHEYRTLAEHGVGEGDRVQSQETGEVYTISVNNLLRTDRLFRVISRATKPASDRLHFDDLTAITCPFGMLDDDTQERLKAWPHGWEAYGECGWVYADAQWRVHVLYRAKPAPVVKEWVYCAYIDPTCDGWPFVAREMSNPTHHLIFVTKDGETTVKMEPL